MDFLTDIEACLSVLRNGGSILYPTDTIWGIGCDATDEKAVEKIFDIKRRPKEKSMIVLLANERDLLNYVAAPDPAVFDYLEKLDKPTTVIYDNAIHLADNLLAPDGSVGIRIVNDPFCKQLINRLKKPLVSTSANISGEKPPARFSEIGEAIRNAVDYIVHYRRDDESSRQSSAVVQFNKDGSVKVLRE